MESTLQLAAKIDGLCSRLEDLIGELTAEAHKRPNPYAKIRETHPNAGKPWSGADDEEIVRLFTAGNALDDLALLFGRTTKAVRIRLEHLGHAPALQPPVNT